MTIPQHDQVGRHQPLAPVPNADDGIVVIQPPAEGPGYWAGGPSAVVSDGDVYLAYRLRRPVDEGRGYANVVARSADGERFETVAVLDKADFETASLERPALAQAPDGSWRLYVSCSTLGSLHWWIDVLEAAHPSEFDAAKRTTVFPGSDTRALKDPVVMWHEGQWHAWVCLHDITTPDQADRMSTLYATSADGYDWDWQGTAMSGRPGQWDARGARLTSVLLGGAAPVAYYDGRADATQNWEEQTGIARGKGLARFEALDDRAAASSPHGAHGLRYLSALELPDGAHRLYYEATRPDGAHDLRTEYVPPTR